MAEKTSWHEQRYKKENPDTTDSREGCSEQPGMRTLNDHVSLALKTLIVVNSFKLHLNPWHSQH